MAARQRRWQQAADFDALGVASLSRLRWAVNLLGAAELSTVLYLLFSAQSASAYAYRKHAVGQLWVVAAYVSMIWGTLWQKQSLSARSFTGRVPAEDADHCIQLAFVEGLSLLLLAWIDASEAFLPFSGVVLCCGLLQLSLLYASVLANMICFLPN